MPKPLESPLTYYLQSRDQQFHPGCWSEWSCCSPHYETLIEAREHYDGWDFDFSARYWPEELRLVRSRALFERLPLKADLYAKLGETKRILARKASDL